MVTPLSPTLSSVGIMNESGTLELVDGRKSPGRRPQKIHLSISPKELDAISARALGMNRSSSLNAELPLRPEAVRMNADMCFTPASSKRFSGVFAPPVRHQSVDIEFHLFSPTMPRGLFLPDDI